MLLEFAKKDNFEQPQINAFMVKIGKIQINSQTFQSVPMFFKPV